MKRKSMCPPMLVLLQKGSPGRVLWSPMLVDNKGVLFGVQRQNELVAGNIALEERMAKGLVMPFYPGRHPMVG
jgi:hypothetical protein